MYNRTGCFVDGQIFSFHAVPIQRTFGRCKLVPPRCHRTQVQIGPVALELSVSQRESWSQFSLRLGCSGVGYTIYPGSAHRNAMYEALREITAEAKEVGLAMVVWSYPRGGGLSKAGETAIDVAAYAAQIAAQLGAHIIKVKAPTEHIELDAARKVYEQEKIPIATLADRVRHVVQSAFDGKRIVIFSGGAAKDTEALLEEIRGIHAGGGYGSIIGRNSFQRPKQEALDLLGKAMSIYAN